MTHWMKVVFALMPLLALVLPAAAQGTPTGTLYGYVLDPDQRVVPGTRIAVESANSGETHNAVTNSDGLYSVPALDPGPYSQPGMLVSLQHDAVLADCLETAFFDGNASLSPTCRSTGAASVRLST